MTSTYKQIRTQEVTKKKKPLCQKDRQAIARICVDQACKTRNHLMCCVDNCPCNKTHSKCNHFINYGCFQNTVLDLQRQNYKDLFQKVLMTLSKVIKGTIEKYNELVVNYETFFLPGPMLEAKKDLDTQGLITPGKAINLKKFYDQFSDYQIPKLIEIEKYKLGVDKVTAQCNQFMEVTSKFHKNLLLGLVDHEKVTKEIIQQTNIEIDARNRNSSAQKEEGRRNQSKDKSLEKK